MDSVSDRITPMDHPSHTAFDSFSDVGVGETTTAHNSIIRPQKRPRGRPKGSKNMRKPTPPLLLEARLRSPPLETRFLNSKAAGEPTANDNVLRLVERPMGRRKGSKNKSKTVPPPPETRFLNSTAAVDESIGNNHVVKRPVGRPKGSKKKPETPPPPLIEINSLTIIQLQAGTDVVQWLLDFCRRYQVSLKLLNASGQISNIIPYHHTSSVIHGPFEILSLSGIIMWTPPRAPKGTTFPLEVSLSSLDGTVCSATVGRSATAASRVKVVATTMTADGDDLREIYEAENHEEQE